MQKLVLFGIFFLFFSCDDGDLQIETLDFDSVNLQFCESATTAASTLFFKINDDEALILELQSGILQNEATETPITSAVPGQSKITYRIFSGTVSSGYFCDDIPPTTPTVSQEIEAESGSVMVTTTAVDSITYEHTIELSGISLVNTSGERITDQTINNFGTVTTTVEN